MNAAIWLGAAVFLALGIAPASSSAAMRHLLGGNHFPYFSEAVGQIFVIRYFGFHFLCCTVALLHLVAEWLYMGRPRRKLPLALLAGLLVLGLLGRFWLEPHLQQSHLVAHAVNVKPAERIAAAGSFRTWHAVFQMYETLVIGALVAYLWRVANPADSTRFVSSVKFRG